MYDKASIALIPSGTKASKLYSVLPANGDGDFTHSRSLTTATRVNKDGFIESVDANTPRLNYPLTGVDCPHLLLEPQRTNSIPYSVFDAGVPTGWAVGFGTGTFTHELTTFRGQSAIKHTQLTTGRSYLQDSVTLDASTTYTFSMYVDLENSGDITSNEVIAAISMTGDSGDDEVSFGEVDQNTGLCQFTFTTTSSATCNIRIGFGAFSDSTQLNKPLIFSMPQLEAGSYPTSYIPTSGSAETRSADVCNSAGTSAEFNDSEGVLYFEAKTDNSSTGSISINNGTSSVRITARFRADISKIQMLINGSTDDFSFNSSLLTLSEYNKIAIVYNNGQYYFFVNGVKSTIQNKGTFSTNSFTQMDFDRGGGSEVFYGKCKQLIYFNEALSDSELQTLTS